MVNNRKLFDTTLKYAYKNILPACVLWTFVNFDEDCHYYASEIWNRRILYSLRVTKMSPVKRASSMYKFHEKNTTTIGDVSSVSYQNLTSLIDFEIRILIFEISHGPCDRRSHSLKKLVTHWMRQKFHWYNIEYSKTTV